MRLSEAEHQRISSAIMSAEQTTSGEIFCMVTQEADDYRAVPFACAALAAIVLPPFFLWFGWPYLALATMSGWSNGSDIAATLIISSYAMLSVIIFMVTFVVTRLPPIRRMLTPRSLKHAAVHRAALESFLSHGIHVTKERTGVLIFLSVEDHVAEIVADEGIYTKVENEIWGDALETLLTSVRADRLAEGFVQVIEKSGAILAQHFPPCAQNPNELPDKLIEI